jgi:hypothetical protein
MGRDERLNPGKTYPGFSGGKLPHLADTLKNGG